LVGLVTFERALRAPREAWPTTPIQRIVAPLADLPHVSARTPLVDALDVVAAAPIVVVEDAGKTLGLIERDRLHAALLARTEALAVTRKPRWLLPAYETA
jgi:hypothetical protein